MNKTGPIKSKVKKEASVLDEDTAGELLADDVSDGSDDEMLDLGEEPTEDGDYDYEDVDSDAFEEDKDLLRDDSDVELGTISDDSASEDGVMKNDDDVDAFLESG
jgi:ribosome biogenesis protein MAK21